MQQVVAWVTQKSRRRFHTSGQLRAREHYTHGQAIWVRLLDGNTSNQAPQLSGPIFVPSFAVLHAALPLLEDRCFPLQNCVLLQSLLRVLSDTLSAKEYRALCKCLANGFVDAHLYLNEQTQETWTLQQSHQLANEHLAELVQRAYSAIAQQFPDAVVQVCVLDKVHDPLAGMLNVPMCTIKEAFDQLGGVDASIISRLEMLAARVQTKYQDSANKGSSKTEYERYLSDKDMSEGLTAGTLLEGTLHVLPHNAREAEVHVNQGGNISVFLVQGRHNMNRALNGDKVCIRVLPREAWAESESQRSLTFGSDAADDSIESEATDETKQHTSSDRVQHFNTDVVPACKVVGCIRRQFNQYVCTILRDSLTKDEGRDEYVLAIPLDKTIPKLRMRTKQGHDLAGQRIVVQFDDWSEDSMYPNGHFITAIGDAGDWHVEVATLLQEKGLVFPPFSTAALACLPAVPVPPVEQPNQPWVDSLWTPSATEIASRKDLRDLRVFSIDPPGCQDIDDAMSARWLDDTTLEVGVHIADVTHFLEQNSPLDRAAQQRATTVYLVHKRFDMLPKLLSGDICSLHQDKDRYAFSVLWRMHVFDANDDRQVRQSDAISLDQVLKFVPQGEGVWVGKTIIHSCAAMTYNQADRLVHDLSPDPTGVVFPPPGQAGQAIPASQWEGLRADVKLLTLVARHFRSLRMGSGALELTGGGSELKFRLDADGVPVEVSSKADEEIHHTIAELMILANSTVASTIRTVFPLESLLRKHPPPQSQKVRQLNELTNVLGISFNDQDAHAMQEALERLSKPSEDQPDPSLTTQSLVTSLLIRAMNEAQYVCTGSVANNNQQGTKIATEEVTTSTSLGHYGLGLSNYTHFTSPIRRYADVIVHRQLVAAIHFLRSEQLGGNESISAFDIFKLGIGFDPRNLPRWDPSKEEPSVKAEVQQVIIPESSTISVEAMWKGEPQSNATAVVDLDVAADEDFLDDLLDDVVDFGRPNTAQLTALPSSTYAATAGQQVRSEEELEQVPSVLPAEVQADASQMEPPYASANLARICVHLNEMNRRAKSASMDCQKLFLTLYFKEHIAEEPAVIYEVKDNGFLVYVPKYDLKGAVYLKSRSGTIHARPDILGLPAASGKEAEADFELLEGSRAFPQLTTSFTQEDIRGTKSHVLRVMDGADVLASFRQMDVVTVQIACRPVGAVQRAPTLRLDLLHLGRTKKEHASSHSSKSVTATILEAITSEQPAPHSVRSDQHSSNFMALASGWAILPADAKLLQHDGQEACISSLVDAKALPRVHALDLVWRDAETSTTKIQGKPTTNIYECVVDLVSSFGLSGQVFGQVDQGRLDDVSTAETDEKAARKALRRRQKLRDQTPRKLVGKSRAVRRIRFQGYQPPASQFGLYAGDEQKAGDQERPVEGGQQPGWSQEYAELEELPGFGLGSNFQLDSGSNHGGSSASQTLSSQQELNRHVALATQRTQRLRAEKRHYSKPKG